MRQTELLMDLLQHQLHEQQVRTALEERIQAFRMLSGVLLGIFVLEIAVGILLLQR